MSDSESRGFFEGSGARETRAVLQAGGRGERMGALTEALPKPMLPVAGVPMVERLLRQLLAAGLRDVTVVTGHLGERCQEHLARLPDLPADLRLHFHAEGAARGNAGALAELADDRPCLFLFADLVTDLDLGALLREHARGGASATLCSHYEAHRVRLGELLVEGERVVGYLEKPWKRFLICSGVAVLEPEVLRCADPSRPVGLSDLVGAALARGLVVRHWEHGAFWMDVNSPEDLARASEALRARP